MPLDREEVLDSAASTHGARLAGPFTISRAGRHGVVSGGKNSEVVAESVESTGRQSSEGDEGSPPANACSDSDEDMQSEEGEKDEDAAGAYFYSVPPGMKDRIKQVKHVFAHLVALYQVPLSLDYSILCRPQRNIGTPKLPLECVQLTQTCSTYPPLDIYWARRGHSVATPTHRLTPLQVTRLCRKGYLAKAQSPMFAPDDPTKAPTSTSLHPFGQLRVYVHAPQRYYASRGIPSHPPCPKCGWKAVEEREVSNSFTDEHGMTRRYGWVVYNSFDTSSHVLTRTLISLPCLPYSGRQQRVLGRSASFLHLRGLLHGRHCACLQGLLRAVSEIEGIVSCPQCSVLPSRAPFPCKTCLMLGEHPGDQQLRVLYSFFCTCAVADDNMQALVEEWKGDEEGKQRRIAAMKANPFTFRSYDPAVTKLYAQRYPWIGAANRVVVCTRKTAMSLELAHLMKRLMTTGETPMRVRSCRKEL